MLWCGRNLSSGANLPSTCMIVATSSALSIHYHGVWGGVFRLFVCFFGGLLVCLFVSLYFACVCFVCPLSLLSVLPVICRCVCFVRPLSLSVLCVLCHSEFCSHCFYIVCSLSLWLFCVFFVMSALCVLCNCACSHPSSLGVSAFYVPCHCVYFVHPFSLCLLFVSFVIVSALRGFCLCVCYVCAVSLYLLSMSVFLVSASSGFRVCMTW